MNTISILIMTLFCVSAYMWLAGFTSPLGTFMTLNQGTGQIEWSEIRIQIYTTIAVSVAGAIGGYFAGGNSFQFALFSGIATFFFSFVGLPLSVMSTSGMPFELKLLFGGVFSLSVMLVILEWFSGR